LLPEALGRHLAQGEVMTHLEIAKLEELTNIL